MLHCGLLWLLPVLLTLGFAIPIGSARDVYLGGGQRAEIATAFVGGTFALRDDEVNVSGGQWSDDDDRILPAPAISAQPLVAFRISACRLNDFVRCTYRYSRRFPRGPPERR